MIIMNSKDSKKNKPGKVIDLEKIIDNGEIIAWYKLTPAERFLESRKLWEVFVLFGGSYDSEPDTQSPFNIFKV